MMILLSYCNLKFDIEVYEIVNLFYKLKIEHKLTPCTYQVWLNFAQTVPKALGSSW